MPLLHCRHGNQWDVVGCVFFCFAALQADFDFIRLFVLKTHKFDKKNKQKKCKNIPKRNGNKWCSVTCGKLAFLIAGRQKMWTKLMGKKQRKQTVNDDYISHKNRDILCEFPHM